MIDSEYYNTQTAETSDPRVAELLAANAALEIQLKDQLLSAERRREELAGLYEELNATKAALSATKKDRDKQKKKASKLQRQVSNIQASLSFRIGRAITWLPRKIRALFSGKPSA